MSTPIVHTTFGAHIKSLREEHRIGLREFCKKISFDPSRWSKIERGQLQPPHDDSFFTQIADVFDIQIDSEAWHLLKDLASIDRGEIPADVDEAKVLKALPAFFRTMRGERPTEEDLKSLLNIIRTS